jgi:hypothetical protein
MDLDKNRFKEFSILIYRRMTEMTMRLPLELANSIYKFVGKSPTAKIIREHLRKKEACICDICNEETESKYFMVYANQCDMCYVNKHPHRNTGLGRECDVCRQELHMYKWCKITGINGGEFCIDCYSQMDE